VHVWESYDIVLSMSIDDSMNHHRHDDVDYVVHIYDNETVIVDMIFHEFVDYCLMLNRYYS
jgi:hypothetical protein